MSRVTLAGRPAATSGEEMTERYWHLRAGPLFEMLDAEELTRLERQSSSRKFSRGELIYLPADLGDSALLLVDGRVRLFAATPEGKQGVLGYVEPGELFGELPVITGGKRDEFAEATATSLVVSVPREEILRLVSSQPSFALEITKLIGFRRKRYERRLKALLFKSTRERLIHLLLEFAERYGRQARPETPVAFAEKFTHQELANVIGSTRESVTVLLGTLQYERLIEVRRRRIILTNLPALAAEVGQSIPGVVIDPDLLPAY